MIQKLKVTVRTSTGGSKIHVNSQSGSF